MAWVTHILKSYVEQAPRKPPEEPVEPEEFKFEIEGPKAPFKLDFLRSLGYSPNFLFVTAMKFYERQLASVLFSNILFGNVPPSLLEYKADINTFLELFPLTHFVPVDLYKVMERFRGRSKMAAVDLAPEDLKGKISITDPRQFRVALPTFRNIYEQGELYIPKKPGKVSPTGVDKILHRLKVENFVIVDDNEARLYKQFVDTSGIWRKLREAEVRLYNKFREKGMQSFVPYSPFKVEFPEKPKKSAGEEPETTETEQAELPKLTAAKVTFPVPQEIDIQLGHSEIASTGHTIVTYIVPQVAGLSRKLGELWVRFFNQKFGIGEPVFKGGIESEDFFSAVMVYWYQLQRQYEGLPFPDCFGVFLSGFGAVIRDKWILGKEVKRKVGKLGKKVKMEVGEEEKLGGKPLSYYLVTAMAKILFGPTGVAENIVGSRGNLDVAIDQYKKLRRRKTLGDVLELHKVSFERLFGGIPTTVSAVWSLAGKEKNRLEDIINHLKGEVISVLSNNAARQRETWTNALYWYDVAEHTSIMDTDKAQKSYQELAAKYHLSQEFVGYEGLGLYWAAVKCQKYIQQSARDIYWAFTIGLNSDFYKFCIDVIEMASKYIKAGEDVGRILEFKTLLSKYKEVLSDAKVFYDKARSLLAAKDYENLRELVLVVSRYLGTVMNFANFGSTLKYIDESIVNVVKEGVEHGYNVQLKVSDIIKRYGNALTKAITDADKLIAIIQKSPITEKIMTDLNENVVAWTSISINCFNELGQLFGGLSGVAKDVVVDRFDIGTISPTGAGTEEEEGYNGTKSATVLEIPDVDQRDIELKYADILDIDIDTLQVVQAIGVLQPLVLSVFKEIVTRLYTIQSGLYVESLKKEFQKLVQELKTKPRGIDVEKLGKRVTEEQKMILVDVPNLISEIIDVWVGGSIPKAVSPPQRFSVRALSLKTEGIVKYIYQDRYKVFVEKGKEAFKSGVYVLDDDGDMLVPKDIYCMIVKCPYDPVNRVKAVDQFVKTANKVNLEVMAVLVPKSKTVLLCVKSQPDFERLWTLVRGARHKIFDIHLVELRQWLAVLTGEEELRLQFTEDGLRTLESNVTRRIKELYKLLVEELAIKALAQQTPEGQEVLVTIGDFMSEVRECIFRHIRVRIWANFRKVREEIEKLKQKQKGPIRLTEEESQDVMVESVLRALDDVFTTLWDEKFAKAFIDETIDCAVERIKAIYGVDLTDVGSVLKKFPLAEEWGEIRYRFYDGLSPARLRPVLREIGGVIYNQLARGVAHTISDEGMKRVFMYLQMVRERALYYKSKKGSQIKLRG